MFRVRPLFAFSRPALALPPIYIADASLRGIVYAAIALLLAVASLLLSVGMQEIMLVAFLPALMLGVYFRNPLGALAGLSIGFGLALALPIARPSLADGLAWLLAALVAGTISALLIEFTRKRSTESPSRAAHCESEHGTVSQLITRIDGELLSNISHELRTPMYGIVGMTELALNEDLSPPLRDYLQTAQNAADTLLVLVDEILDYVKLESGKFQLQPASLRLHDL